MQLPKPFPLLNRELSRLDYNRRVLAKAEEQAVPPLERLRYLAYSSHNLDEFFMVRVGATRDLMDAGITERSADGLTPAEQMTAIRTRSRELLEEMYRCLNESVLPELEANGIVIARFDTLTEQDQELVREYFRREIAPILTPLAIDPGHPFPFVANRTLNIAATVESDRAGSNVVLLKIPPLAPRFFSLGGGRFVPVGSIIVANLASFFPSLRVTRAVLFRVIRNSELSIDGDEVIDLRDSVEAELRRRERKQVVCLEIDARAEEEIVRLLIEGTRTRPEDVYRVAGFLKMGDLAEICDIPADPKLRYPDFNPRLPQRLASQADIFSIIASGDILLHRPYESFTAVIELLHAAATDPAVLAIKQTLYQTDELSPIVDKLAMAALNGKQVSVIIELQARFEEKKNIALARRLQDAGAQVVYGLVGVQTHAKLALIIRAEGDGLRHYVHLSTGNYNVESARSYTDLDLLTANEAFGREASQLLNILTGYSSRTLADAFEQQSRPQWQHFVMAPFDYHRWLLGRIEQEARNAAEGKPARVVAKLNSLVEPQVIQALYAASAAGVKVDLIVRSMCSLVPGLKKVSENIRVISIVDRFLEHSRILLFENGGKPEVFLSSGDWMPRNFQSRIEITFPLLERATREAAISILDIGLGDTASSWELQPDGEWKRRGNATGLSSQKSFIDISRAESFALEPYREAVAQAGKSRKRGKKSRRDSRA